MTDSAAPELSEKTESNSLSDEELLEQARERFRISAEASRKIRQLAEEDHEFRAGYQWNQQDIDSRKEDDRPSLVINRIPQFIHQVTNDLRQNRPAGKVGPVDDTSDVETAKIIQGMVRHIEYNSSADIAYDTAFEHMAIGGLGFYRIVTEYCDPMSFDQDIKIKRIRDWRSVYEDPGAKEPDGSDYNWGFVVEDIPEDEFKRKYPGRKDTTDQGFTSMDGEQKGDWLPADCIRVAEYFYKEFSTEEIVLFSDGMVKLAKECTPELLAQAEAAGVTVKKRRKTQKVKIKWAKITGAEVLERGEFPGVYIPIVPVIGDELIVKGERVLEGIVRHAKDPQRMYNYMASSQAEAIALAPKAPWVGAEGQFEGYENDWLTANKKSHGYLTYKPKTIGNELAPPPSRNIVEPPVQAINQARMQAADELKATTGIYDAALGAKSNEASGRAIERRNQQSQTSNFHLSDNLRRSQRHGLRIIVGAIPVVYDAERAIRILGEGDEEQIVTINRVFKDGEKQTEPAYDMSVGRYDVTMDTGPSFATKRQEAAASMLDLLKNYPAAAPAVADLMVKNMDWPGAKEIAERLKKLAPPGIIESKENKEIPPEVQNQLAQSSQMIEQLTAELNQSNQVLEQKKMELESKERIEFAKLENQATIELAKLESGEAIKLLTIQVGELNQRLKMIGIDQPIDEEQNAGLGPEQAAPEIVEQPTGGLMPGPSMEQP